MIFNDLDFSQHFDDEEKEKARYDDGETFVERPMQSESATEVAEAKAGNLFGGVDKTEMFYKN